MEHPVESRLVSWDEYERLSKIHAIRNTSVVNEDSPGNNVIVEFDKKPDIEICDNDRWFVESMLKVDRERRSLKACVAIAAATTAYARISIYKYLENAHYTDTDSIMTNVPLSPDQVGDGLGMMKLERKIDEALFVRPKVYFIRTGDIYDFKFKGVPRGTAKVCDY